MIIFMMIKPVIVHMFRKYLIVPILLIAITDLAHSTSTLTDSLLILAGKAEGHERIRLLNQVAQIQLDFQPESSLKYSNMALEASRTRGNLSDQAEALKNIGAAWVSLGDIGKATPFLDEADGIYRNRLEEKESFRDNCHVALILMLKGQFEKSIDYYQRALEMEGEDDPAGIARCLNGMGETYRKMGQFMQSIDFYTRSLEIFQEMGTEYGMDRLLYDIGLNYQRLARYDEALRNLYASLAISQKLRNLTQMGHTYQVTGSTYLQLEDLEKALEYHRKSLAIHEQLGERSGVANALDVLAGIHLEMEQFDQALRMYNRSYELRRNVGNKRMIVSSQMNLGRYFTHRQNYPLALSYYRDALELAGELQDKWSLARISVNLGELYGFRKEYSTAFQYLEDALSIAEGMESKDIQRDAYHALYEMHKMRGNYQLSLEYYLNYAAIREAMMNVESRTSIANLESRYDLVNKEKEIERLEKENIANQLDLQQEKSLRNYLISLAAFLMVLGIIIAFSLVRNRRMNLMLKHKNQELEELNKRLTKYSEELDELNQTKNRLISIISHDLKNPFHSLIGFSDLLVLEAERFSEEEKLSFYKSINETSKKAFELLQNLLDWTRLQTSEIPFKPTDLRVTETIQSVFGLVNSYARDKGIVMQTKVSEDTMVYADSRMFETVLRNILSHAVKYTPFGGKISISARDQNEVIQFDVEDTGVGMDGEQVANLFDVDKKASRPGTNNELGTGFGLILCREFVKKNGGELTVESSPGKGSTFSFTVPKRRST
jgi:signal transduction histidine kinase